MHHPSVSLDQLCYIYRPATEIHFALEYFEEKAFLHGASFVLFFIHIQL